MTFVAYRTLSGVVGSFLFFQTQTGMKTREPSVHLLQPLVLMYKSFSVILPDSLSGFSYTLWKQTGFRPIRLD